MIFIMSMKTWSKHKKKLVIPKDYMIIDGTDDDNAKLSAFTNTVTMDQFNPPPNLIKCLDRIEKDEDVTDILDYDRLDKLEDNYINGIRLKTAVLATVSGLAQDDINIFLILRNKVFKSYKKRIRRAFLMTISVPFNYVVLFGNHQSPSDISKELNYTFTEKELDRLQESIEEQEAEMKRRVKKQNKKRKNKYKKY